MKNTNSLRKLAEFEGCYSLYVDGYSFIIQVKNEKGRVVNSYYYPTLSMCLTELTQLFILDNIPVLKELKEFNVKFESFCEKLKKECRNITRDELK